jgi:hypothetical protein
MGNNESRRLAFRQLFATEFACLSSSRQLMLLTILRAQLSSRKAIAATAESGDGRVTSRHCRCQFERRYRRLSRSLVHKALEEPLLLTR